LKSLASDTSQDIDKPELDELLAKLMTMKNELLTVESNGKSTAGALGMKIYCYLRLLAETNDLSPNQSSEEGEGICTQEGGEEYA